MKKCVELLLLALLLGGCTGEPVTETVADSLQVPVLAEPAHIRVELPGEAALPVMENDNGRIYVWDDCTLVLQTLPAGDLEQTLYALSGRGREDLTVLRIPGEGRCRYELVWAAAGEGGDKTGRAVILEEGNYHYCMSLLQDTAAPEKSQICWDQVFSSFSLG